MFTVKSTQQTLDIVRENFGQLRMAEELVPILDAYGRVLASDIQSRELVPSFHRSTVDGYAVTAQDTFGCSESIPAVLRYLGAVQMGQDTSLVLHPGECAYVPTGGKIPSGADAMVMIEHAEDFQDGFIYANKPSAPGQHIIFAGDDVIPGQLVLPAGRKLCAQDIGTLAALGYSKVPVRKRPVVGIISTGDEIVGIDETPQMSQIRDVNTYSLYAGVIETGGEPRIFGVVQDDVQALLHAVAQSVPQCDLLLISGGSSVGVKDATCRVIEELGEGIFVHGIAIKPGKPTIIGSIRQKPVYGLPGHPVSALFIYHLFVRPLIYAMLGESRKDLPASMELTQSIPSNHGREECVPVRVVFQNAVPKAEPIIGKSGLISSFSQADGYLRIDRDCEGLAAGEMVGVYRF